MSTINGIGANLPIQKTIQPAAAQSTASVSEGRKPTPAVRLEISETGQVLKSAEVGDVRMEKVAAIKAQIEAGTYETPMRIAIATDRLLDELLR